MSPNSLFAFSLELIDFVTFEAGVMQKGAIK